MTEIVVYNCHDLVSSLEPYHQVKIHMLASTSLIFGPNMKKHEQPTVLQNLKNYVTSRFHRCLNSILVHKMSSMPEIMWARHNGLAWFTLLGLLLKYTNPKISHHSAVHWLASKLVNFPHLACQIHSNFFT
jgi:hypothetical protein